MRYIAVLHTNGIGGVWSVVRESLVVLKKFYDVLLVLYVRNGDLRDEVKCFLNANNIEFKIIDIKANNGIAFDLKRFFNKNVLNCIVGNEPAIIHSHDSFLSCSYLPFLHTDNRLLFCTFHGTLIQSESFKGRIQFWINRYIRIGLLKRSRIHFISCDPLSIPIIKKYFNKPIEIHLAVNGVASARKGHKRDEGSFTIGYVSRFHPLKNWHIVANSVEELSLKGYNIKVLFAGSGECYEEVRRWCKEHPNISKFVGYCNNVKDEIIPNIDLHVLPSEYPEGLPMIILESMAAGVPSIVSDTGSCAFAVKDGETGFVVKPNVKAVSSTIELLIRDRTLYNKLSDNCIADWNNRFSSESMAKSYKRIFDSYQFTE